LNIYIDQRSWHGSSSKTKFGGAGLVLSGIGADETSTVLKGACMAIPLKQSFVELNLLQMELVLMRHLVQCQKEPATMQFFQDQYLLEPD